MSAIRKRLISITGVLILYGALSSLSLLYPDEKADQKKIDEAVDRGVQFLLKRGVHGNVSELMVYALLHAGVTNTNPDLQKWIDYMIGQRLYPDPYCSTYRIALMAMALEMYDRVKYQRQIWDCAQALVDSQLKNGQWSYDTRSRMPVTSPTAAKEPPPVTEVITSRDVKKDPSNLKPLLTRRTRPPPAVPRDVNFGFGDNSNTQFALLGLRAASRSKIIIPKETWKKAEEFLLTAQLPDGGWGYYYFPPELAARVRWSNPSNTSYGSMTAAGVCGLIITKVYSGEYAAGSVFKDTPAIKKGLNWLAKHLRFDRHPGVKCWKEPDAPPHPFHYYWLYSIERVGSILGIEKIGDHDWYQEGVDYLLKQQREDGSWGPGWGSGWSFNAKDVNLSDGIIIDTCFAILFLKKSTPKLILTPGASKPIPTPRPLSPTGKTE